MKIFLLFAVITITLVALSGWLLTLWLDSPADVAAIWISAVVAIVVQLVAFGTTRALAGRNLVAGWGVGAIFRFGTLIIYALVGVKLLGLPAVAALLSIALFFFVTTLVEPLLLKP